MPRSPSPSIHSRSKYSTQTQDIPLQFPAPPLDVLQQHQCLGCRPTTVHEHEDSPIPFQRQCMAEDILEDGAHRKIGGPGHIIEIDESKFGKRKYNRGRRVVGKWILGGFCRTTDECFLVECPKNRRDHHTLLRLIKLYVAPGTIILTDKWKGYSALPRHGYVHLVVNHSRGFVYPLAGVHTNTCEGMWFHAKKHMLRGHGRTRADSEALEIALCEFMWRKRLNLTRSDASVRRAFNSEIPKLMRRVLS